MDDRYKYLGTALAYPLRLENGSPVVISGPAVIEASIYQLLTIPKNSRLLLPQFGSDIEGHLFDPADETMRGILRFYIQEVFKWETRANFKDVIFTLSEDNVIMCEIIYEILQVHEVQSFVWPYYTNLIY